VNAPEHFLGAGKKFKEPHKKHKPLHFRTIWISDIHLGTTGCQAKRLLEFLKATESDKLYLVGDIVDGWQLKRRWYWHQTHNDVVQLVMKKAKKGTKVFYPEASNTVIFVIMTIVLLLKPAGLFGTQK